MADNTPVAGSATSTFPNWVPLLHRLYGNIPGVPVVSLEELLDTILKLGLRTVQILPAKNALSNSYTIGGRTATGYAFLYGDLPNDAVAAALEELKARLNGKSATEILELFGVPAPTKAKNQLTPPSLDSPEQFALTWTTFEGVYQNALPLLDTWSKTLTDPAVAEQLFWPTIASYGLAYNLMIVKKVGGANAARRKALFQDKWTPAWDELVGNGLLYEIDLTIFNTLQPQQADDGSTRFTPATLTMLRQDPKTKALTPVAVTVSGYQGSGTQTYLPGTGAWLYALQAAKTSITVWGTWLGHVYHWHLVTGAMQQAMFLHLDNSSALYKLVAPRSKYLNAFDTVLLLAWQIAPPTSLTSSLQFLELCNTFAAGRSFFDDDPLVTLDRLGLQQADFTVNSPWDQYPLVGHLLKLWDATAAYVDAFMKESYPTDASVANDQALQAWMAEAADPSAGNIRGLPAMKTREALASVLTSLLYRVTAHGSGRLPASSNPGLTFIANFPPCLQNKTVPEAGSTISTKQLLQYLPNTGTLGAELAFYNTFAFSVPYEPFIPLQGIDCDLIFPKGLEDPRNQALVKYRQAIVAMIEELSGKFFPQITQWPLNVET
jgi:hypothetical protein